MAFFKNRKSDKQFKLELETEALEKKQAKENFENFTLPIDIKEEQRKKAPMVITPEELAGLPLHEDGAAKPKRETENIEMHKSMPKTEDFLFKKMLEARAEAEMKTKSSAPEGEIKSNVPSDTEDKAVSKNSINIKSLNLNISDDGLTPKDSPAASVPKSDGEISMSSANIIMPDNKAEQNASAQNNVSGSIDKIENDKTQPSNINTDESVTLNTQQSIDEILEKLSIKAEKNVQNNLNKSFIEDISSGSELFRQADNGPAAEKSQPKPSVKNTKHTLSDRCRSFIEDAEAPDEFNSFELESVDEILAKMEKKAADKVNSIYGAPNPSDNLAGQKKTAETAQKPKETETINIKGIWEPQLPKTEPKNKIPPEYRVIKNEKPKNDRPAEEKAKTKPSDAVLQNPTEVIPIIKEEDFIDAEDIVAKNEKSTDDPRISEGVTFETNIFSKLDLDELKPKKSVESAEKEEIKIPSKSDDTFDEDDDDFESFEDYKTTEDRGRILKELLKTRFKTRIRLFITLILAAAAFIFELPFLNSLGDTAVYISFSAFAAAVLVNLNIFAGANKVFKGRVEPDLPLAISTVIVLIYNILSFTVFKADGAVTLCFAGTLPLLFACLGRLSQISRIRRNFLKLATDDTKYAIGFIDDPAVQKEAAALTGYMNANVCAERKTVNVLDFMRHSMCREPNSKSVTSITVAGLILSVIGAIGAALAGSAANAMLVLACGAVITASPVIYMLSNLPLKLAATRLNYYNAALFGFSSAEKLDKTNTAVIDVGDIFPDGTVRLIDFKLLSPNPIDQTLLDAAALTHNAKSPLAGIFMQITDMTDSKVPPVDTVVYEDNMGVSGWVDNRRIFIGNRTLMETHGFTTPSIEIDKKILQRGYFPVYLGSEGVLCALLIVKYTAHPEIAYELRRLAATGTSILINNCDQNVSAEMVIDYLGLYEDSVFVMNSNMSRGVKKATEFQQSTPAYAMAGRSVCGFAAAITAAIKVKKLNKIMLALYIIITLAGVAGLAVLGVMGRLSFINSILLGAFTLASMLICCIPPYFSRP